MAEEAFHDRTAQIWPGRVPGRVVWVAPVQFHAQEVLVRVEHAQLDDNFCRLHHAGAWDEPGFSDLRRRRAALANDEALKLTGRHSALDALAPGKRVSA